MRLLSKATSIVAMTLAAATLTTTPAHAADPVTVSPVSLSFTAGTAVGDTFVASGGSGSGYTFSYGGQSTVPTGISIDLTSGTISGTPLSAGEFYDFSIVATDDAQSSSDPVEFSGNVAEDPNAGGNGGISCAPGQHEDPVTTQCVEDDPPVPTCLPNETYDPNTNSCIPNSDPPSCDPGYHLDETLTCQPDVVTPPPGPDCQTPGQPLNAGGTDCTVITYTGIEVPVTATQKTLVSAGGASGGSGSYVFTTTNAVPYGLTLDPSGSFTGTATPGAPSTELGVRVSDASDPSVYTDGIVTLDLVAPTVTVTAPAPVSGVVGTAIAPVQVASAGGLAPRTLAVSSGHLPAGLELTPAGVLQGTPTEAGTSTFAVTARDASVGTGAPYSSAPVTLTVTVTPAQVVPQPVVRVPGPVGVTIALSAHRQTKGSRLVITGTVVQDGLGLAGRVVTIDKHTPGKHPRSTIATVLTDRTGHFRYVVGRVTSTKYFRATSGGVASADSLDRVV